MTREMHGTQVLSLIILFSVDCAILTFNLIFALYISIIYFCRLRVKAPLIILFYVFADLTTLFRLVEMVFVLLDLLQYDDSESKILRLFTEPKVEICRSIAYLTYLTVGVIVVSTMFQIGLSLRMVSGEIDFSRATNMSRGFYVVMYLIMFLASGIELFLHIYYDENIDDIRLNKIFDTLWFTLVTIIYIIVIVFLIKQLNKINEQELRQEKISIIRQFVIFLVGYVIGVIYTFIEYFNPTQYSYFVDQVSLSVSVILWDAIPVTYMLFVHHRTFRSMIR